MLGHSLLALTQRASAYEPRLSDLRESGKTLDAYYISSRYPNGLTDEVALDFFDPKDGERTLVSCRAILAAIESLLPGSVTLPG